VPVDPAGFYLWSNTIKKNLVHSFARRRQYSKKTNLYKPMLIIINKISLKAKKAEGRKF